MTTDPTSNSIFSLKTGGDNDTEKPKASYLLKDKYLIVREKSYYRRRGRRYLDNHELHVIRLKDVDLRSYRRWKESDNYEVWEINGHALWKLLLGDRKEEDWVMNNE